MDRALAAARSGSSAAEASDLPGIASWRTPQPVSTGESVGQLATGAGAVKDKGPGHRDHDQLEEEPTLRTQVESVEEVP
jgi:hypothetical protein